MKASTIRIAMAQINPTVGDLEGNRDKILNNVEKACKEACDFIAFPELVITGYPPEDMLLRRQFVMDQLQVLKRTAKQIRNIICVLGFVDIEGKDLYNAAAVIHNKRHLATYRKVHLPNYSVFDEERYFEAGQKPFVIRYNGLRMGISICEDIWIENSVVETEAFDGEAQVLLNISASPYHTGKRIERLNLLKNRAAHTQSTVVYVNLVGGQDELVFDGSSLVVDADGTVLAAAKAFVEDFCVVDLEARVRQPNNHNEFQYAGNLFKEMDVVTIDPKRSSTTKAIIRENINYKVDKISDIYQALLLGIRDYVYKNYFEKVTLGLSGGIDSAMVAVLAVDALGKDNVIAVAMPSQFSSPGSKDDAKKLADNLGIELLEFTIEDIYQAYITTMAETFKGLPFDVTEENIQARIRGNLLMALSNKFGWLVMATGNKSEVSVGYSTLYGDSAGGFSPLKDVYKMTLYTLARYRNQLAGYDLIPKTIIDKPPSAELRPGQLDEDSLPPYDILDRILEKYVESEKGVQEIVEQGYDKEIVEKVARMVDGAEYKRRQAAPGVKITPRAFGKDRRMPITNRYRAR